MKYKFVESIFITTTILKVIISIRYSCFIKKFIKSYKKVYQKITLGKLRYTTIIYHTFKISFSTLEILCRWRLLLYLFQHTWTKLMCYVKLFFVVLERTMIGISLTMMNFAVVTYITKNKDNKQNEYWIENEIIVIRICW